MTKQHYEICTLGHTIPVVQTLNLRQSINIQCSQGYHYLIRLQPAYLIIITCKTNALHGTGVVVTCVVKLTHWHVTVYLIQDWRQSTAESNNLVTMLAESDTHTTLLDVSTTITQNTAEKRFIWKLNKAILQC